ncbi:MAG: hypothetical protein SFW36_10490 [Leptolyngbyaceae cyanobacterium bins.59]|nr:hypothetical protein [Leptolyngbyaceae cyanobacterium bins.59]
MTDVSRKQGSAVLHAIAITIAIALISGYLQPKVIILPLGQATSSVPSQIK